MSFKHNGVEIEDTFAEGFGMWGSRIIITAASQKWADTAATSMTGFATSVIACDCEAGIEARVHPDDSPDGIEGISGVVSTKNDTSKNLIPPPSLEKILIAPE